MAIIDWRTVPVPVPIGTGRRTIPGVATFAPQVQVVRAAVALNGFKLEYVNQHRVLVVEADTDLNNIAGNVVNFSIECDLRDNSGNDDYSGYVTVLVIAEVQ